MTITGKNGRDLEIEKDGRRGRVADQYKYGVGSVGSVVEKKG